MHGHLSHQVSTIAVATDAARDSAWRRHYANGARFLVGTAAIAAAVTIPDFSLLAMGSPYTRVEIGDPQAPLPATIWMPSAVPTAPVYAPVMAAEEIAPASLTFSSRSQAVEIDRLQPLEFIEAGSERFDLAFAGVPQPAPVTLRVPRARPDVASQRAEVSLSLTSKPLEAAFAGAIDVSGAMIPQIAPQPRPVREPAARAIPIPAPDPALDAAAAAQARAVQKERLGARVNGVLAGSVEFRQLDGTIAVKLGSVLDMLRDRFSASEFDQLKSGRSVNSFVTLAQLQAAGIPISYNPAYDEVEFGIDYQDAPQAGKVQVEQIGAPTAMGESAMIDQIPR